MPFPGLEATSDNGALLDLEQEIKPERLDGAKEPPSPLAPRLAFFCGILAKALAIAALCSAGALATRWSGPEATTELGLSQDLGEDLVELALSSESEADLVEAGAGCANWQDAQIGATARDIEASECRMRCVAEPECAFWNYFSGTSGVCSGSNHRGDCALMRQSCEQGETGCWDLYKRPAVQVQAASAHGALVFKPGTDGVSCFRIPAVVRTPGGRLVAFAEARFDDLCMDTSAHKIAVSFSDDSGTTWSQTRYAIGSAQSPVCNPYPIALRSGKILLIYAKHSLEGWDGLAGGGTGMVASADSGETWSAEADVSADFGPAAGAQPGPGAGVALSMGGVGGGVDGVTGTTVKERLLVVSHKGAYVNDFITYSDDEGQTWKTIEQTFPKMDEATLADLGGGEVLLVMRHEAMVDAGRALSRSLDYGMTWGPIEFNKQIPSALSEGSMLHHTNTGATYFAGPLENNQEHFWRRNMIVVRKSTDGGSSWGGDVPIYMREGTGYTSLAPGDAMVPGDGRGVGVLYETDDGIFFSTVQA